MEAETQDETVAAAVIATRVGRGADQIEDAIQGADLQGEIEMTEDDLVVARCLAEMIVTTLLGGRDLHEDAVHSDPNVEKDRVLPGGDGQSLVHAQGVIQNPEFVSNLARGQERENHLGLHAEGREAPRGGPSHPGHDLEKAV